MSKVSKKVQNEDINEEVDENTETQEVTVAEKKRFNLGPKMKKGLKIVGIAGLGILSFVLGTKWGSKSNDNSDDVEDVEYEVVDDDVNE